MLSNEYEDKYEPSSEPSKPTVSDPEETLTDISPTKKGRSKHDKKKKKNDKAAKKAERRGGKAAKVGKNGGKKNGKRLLKYNEKEEYQKPTKRPTPPPKGSLASFLDYFENRRRLLVRDDATLTAHKRPAASHTLQIHTQHYHIIKYIHILLTLRKGGVHLCLLEYKCCFIPLAFTF